MAFQQHGDRPDFRVPSRCSDKSQSILRRDQSIPKMKTTFTYTVLRYVHNIATGEFVNMGVALYAPEAKYVSALCNPRYGRLSKMFLDVNGENLRSLVRYIQARFEEFALKLTRELPLDGHPKSIMEIAAGILPPDDSSLQWSEPNGGITEDPAAA